MDNFFIVPMNPVSFQNDLDLSKNEKILGAAAQICSGIYSRA